MLSGSEKQLLSSTSKLMIDFARAAAESEHTAIRPPIGMIALILAMNVSKRTSATRYAEELVKKGDMVAPPPSLIPTFMASGREIPGVQDEYMMNDHPSQELFAYNRLGKKSWLNKRFGEHCLTAVGFAHPNGIVTSPDSVSRIKAYPSTFGHSNGVGEKSLAGWVVASTKSPIATVNENGRQASLISRVTGAIDITSPELSPDEIEAITELAKNDTIDEHESQYISDHKDVLLNALEQHENNELSPFYPVIQTVYLTQLMQEL